MAQKNVGEVAKTGIAELAKRVPPNQMLQFQNFQAKHSEYLHRVNKQPEKLPNIDWEFYRINVRPEFTKWVDEFQQKYKTVCETFDARGKQDYKKYYVELEKVRVEMQAEVDKFKAESNERIKALQAEHARIKALKPYEEMTAEEYCDLMPEGKMYMHDGRPSFWPHTLDEQSLERKLGHGHDDHGGDHGGNQGKPKKGGGAGAAAAPAAASSKGKSEKAKPESAAKSAKTIEKSGDLLVKESRSSKDLSKSLTDEIRKQTDLANKMVEEEIERALIYAPLEDAHKKERQQVAVKK